MIKDNINKVSVKITWGGGIFNHTIKTLVSRIKNTKELEYLVF